MSEVRRVTESVNPRSRDIDLKSVPEILEIINAEDQLVAEVVRRAIPSIVPAVEAAVKSLSSPNGRMISIGAGTSGRIAVMDAAEIGPTYGIPRERVFALIAGGYDAVVKAAETAEDREELGVAAMVEHRVSAEDTVIGLSASGTTPFVTGALREARRRGAATVGIACNPSGCVLDAAEFPIALVTGAEVVTGSTRMKGGSAQKMCLNMISTATMIRIGRVTGNFMTAMFPANEKLRRRAEFIVASICGISEEEAAAELSRRGYLIRDTVAALRRGAGACHE